MESPIGRHTKQMIMAAEGLGTLPRIYQLKSLRLILRDEPHAMTPFYISVIRPSQHGSMRVSAYRRMHGAARSPRLVIVEFIEASAKCRYAAMARHFAREINYGSFSAYQPRRAARFSHCDAGIVAIE